MVYLGADHGGFRLKNRVREWLLSTGVSVADLGASSIREADDYPRIAEQVARAVRTNRAHRGILLCRSGVGVTIVANKVPGIRAALAWSPRVAVAARTDDDANVVCLPADYVTASTAKATVASFLGTRFAKAARFSRRLREVAHIDAQYRRSLG